MRAGPSNEFREQTPWGELVLTIRPGDPPAAALVLEGTFLMDSESGASEQALARRGVQLLRQVRGGTAPVPQPRVLVGGLGLGITLRALLADADLQSVTVVELFPALIRWNRQHLGFLNGGALDDPRVSCHAGDLLTYLRALPPGARFDLMLLDIDNGPTFLSLPENAQLYTEEGLSLLRASLSDAGVALFWATERSSGFEERLGALSGLVWTVEEIAWRPPRGDRELTDWLYAILPAPGTKQARP